MIPYFVGVRIRAFIIQGPRKTWLWIRLHNYFDIVSSSVYWPLSEQDLQKKYSLEIRTQSRAPTGTARIPNTSSPPFFPQVFSHRQRVSCGLGNERERGGREGTTNMADREDRRRVERSRSNPAWLKGSSSERLWAEMNDSKEVLNLTGALPFYAQMYRDGLKIKSGP